MSLMGSLVDQTQLKTVRFKIVQEKYFKLKCQEKKEKNTKQSILERGTIFKVVIYT